MPSRLGMLESWNDIDRRYHLSQVIRYPLSEGEAGAALPGDRPEREHSTMSDDIRIKTEENELSLREISDALPDTPTIMKRVGECWWYLIYAARGGNWGLADYYLRRVRKLENALKVLRPKHRERLERFQSTALPAVVEAVAAEDLERLEAAYAAATEMANLLHHESGYPYIKWVLPQEPPIGLQLEPVAAPDDVDVSQNGGGSA